MLADLMRYLESALPRMRDDSSTLAREAELIRAFLAVHQVRMGPRLQVRIDVPDAARGSRRAADDAADADRECAQAWPGSASRGRRRSASCGRSRRQARAPGGRYGPRSGRGFRGWHRPRQHPRAPEGDVRRGGGSCRCTSTSHAASWRKLICRRTRHEHAWHKRSPRRRAGASRDWAARAWRRMGWRHVLLALVLEIVRDVFGPLGGVFSCRATPAGLGTCSRSYLDGKWAVGNLSIIYCRARRRRGFR